MSHELEVRRIINALRDLAEYTRDLEEELDGADAGEGRQLVAANSVLADYDHIEQDES